MAADLRWTSATETLRMFGAGELTPLEAMESALDRLEELDPKVNAFLTTVPEQALEQARGATELYASGAELPPLLGLPIAIKDDKPTKGVRTTSGSRLFESYVPDFSSVLVERLEAAGAIVVGKTNLSEFGWKGEAGNRLIGPTRNPFDLKLTAGGSSGGSAAAVAAGILPWAQGGDGAGSIRIPAALCGVFGHKPSHGRVPYHPSYGDELFVAEGPLTRSVADAVLMLEQISGPDPRDRFSLPALPPGQLRAALDNPNLEGRRIAWSPDFGYGEVEAEVLDAVEPLLADLEALGAGVAPVAVPWSDPGSLVEVFFPLALAGAVALEARSTGRAEEQLLEDLDPGLREVVERGLSLSAREIALAELDRIELHRKVGELFSTCDLLVTPTLPVTAFEAGLHNPPTVAGKPATVYSWLFLVAPFNQSGNPAASFPAGLSSRGLPVGLQIVGATGADAEVLGVAAALERSRPIVPSLRRAETAQ